MPEVKCAVSNCAYWGQGNNCRADIIMIEVDEHADADLSSEFAGEEFDTRHKDQAADRANTCCHTFKEKK
ncbi:DUF1540 domain-containing protein [Paenibacillus chitinolyticus]|uniref:DUF1540 domain-containing protein n=1 Tax=Paenibacillus chitinolyticus TaxID=79263 RepID=A0A410X1A8_9BACL|nr:DUF1540 domain-containing protein [Paenibacillus chitinolyticus]MCY9592471.1 DUF1540 domain-containing protein [Paenibacillus chitinolyticus]MCY9594926.1 DUF1540 domain-containing protein [Paenibacillus chitinolyticus]QAV20390.1 DUF1540 domain-containing protein [Paenibacillus chitinolyticus]